MSSLVLLVLASVLLAGCAHRVPSVPFASQAVASRSAVTAVVSPEIRKHALAAVGRSVCIRLDSNWSAYPTPLQDRLQRDLAALLAEKDIHAAFDCSSPTVYFHIQNAGVTSTAAVDGFVRDGYGSPVQLDRDFSAPDSANASAIPYVGFDSLVGMGIQAVAPHSAPPANSVHAIVLDISVPSDGIRSRMVAMVPLETNDWQSTLYGRVEDVLVAGF